MNFAVCLLGDCSMNTLRVLNCQRPLVFLEHVTSNHFPCSSGKDASLFSQDRQSRSSSMLKAWGFLFPLSFIFFKCPPDCTWAVIFFLHCAHRSILWKFSYWSLTPSWTVLVRVLQKVMIGRQMCGDICHTPEIVPKWSIFLWVLWWSYDR